MRRQLYQEQFQRVSECVSISVGAQAPPSRCLDSDRQPADRFQELILFVLEVGDERVAQMVDGGLRVVQPFVVLEHRHERSIDLAQDLRNALVLQALDDRPQADNLHVRFAAAAHLNRHGHCDELSEPHTIPSHRAWPALRMLTTTDVSLARFLPSLSHRAHPPPIHRSGRRILPLDRQAQSPPPESRSNRCSRVWLSHLLRQSQRDHLLGRVPRFPRRVELRLGIDHRALDPCAYFSLEWKPTRTPMTAFSK